MTDDTFDDLRPYRDEEIAAAMHRVAASEHLPRLAAFAFPGRDVEETRALVRACASIEEFQERVMRAVNDQVIARSISRFSHDGLAALGRDEPYLFVSNHRDIMLDSSLLQQALLQAGLRTTEITFGSNLMVSPLVVDIGKSNKMFTLLRGGTPREVYANACRLSAYIRHAIVTRRESVWIAQRAGRAKDGVDATDPAIVKMFHVSAPGDPVTALAALNILPVAVSYQWEPCDDLKALELYHSRSGRYVKRPGEDLESILAGIRRPKGEVHIQAGRPLSREELEPLAALPGSRFNREVAALIDRQVATNYRLTCNNYIAHDLRSRSSRHAGHYSREELAAFTARFHAFLDSARVADKELLATIFLGIYANPVDSRDRTA
jgi:hypothetical protein